MKRLYRASYNEEQKKLYAELHLEQVLKADQGKGNGREPTGSNRKSVKQFMYLLTLTTMVDIEYLKLV